MSASDVAVAPIEDRIAIEDLMVAYTYAVDGLDDVQAVLNVFTADAVFDLSGIGYPSLNGHAEIRAFFEQTFAGMANHAHYLSNFRLDRYDGDRASSTAYIVGMGRLKDGRSITVNARYHFDVVRTSSGWKAARYTMDPLMPVPEFA